MSFFQNNQWIKIHQDEYKQFTYLKNLHTAINRSIAIIEFTPEGKILNANDNFLKILGYQLDEIRDKHHKIFVTAQEQYSPCYAEFWQNLKKGEYNAGEFQRQKKDGSDIWIQATYNPIFNAQGDVTSVIKIAMDITKQKEQNNYNNYKIDAINRAMACIEFETNGTILNANKNFPEVMGYQLNEIVGKKHSIFVSPEYAKSSEYKLFWEKLAKGTYHQGQYKRFGKNGKVAWIQASYNPVFDAYGRVIKVIKFATDISNLVQAETLQDAVKEILDLIQITKDNNLSQRLNLKGKTGLILTLCNGVNNLIDSMVEILSKIKNSSYAISTASKEIATSSVDLSRRATSEVNELKETTNKVNGLTVAIQQNATHSAQAKRSAEDALLTANKGSDSITQLFELMKKINTSASQIEGITSLIESIAFQTNILSLNAAVEAARAGEQGRGFAVVANEVRNLAQKSAVAAKEISTLISQSVENISNGLKQSDLTKSQIFDIVSAVQRITQMINEISSSTKTQSDSAIQINEALANIDSARHQNALLAEEATAATKALEEQAITLDQIVTKYRIS